MDTKELIEPFNKLKDRSNESNICKLDLNLNYNFKHLKPDNKKIEDLVKVEAEEAIKEASPVLTYAAILYTMSSTLFQSLTHDSLR